MCGKILPDPQYSKTSAKSDIIDELKQQIKEKESKLQNAEKVNRNFEKMMQLVTILGQIDSFLTHRTKSVLKKLALLADDDVNYNDKF